MRKFRIGELAAVDSPAQEGARALLMKRAEPDNDALTIHMSLEELAKRTFSVEQRRQLAAQGQALPDGSFPIVNRGDLSNAIQAFGRAANKARAARHIKRRARALGAENMLPEEGLLAKADPAEGDGTMPEDKTAKELEAAQNEVTELKGQLARATAVAELPDVQKALFAKMDEAGQTAYLALKPEERQAQVDKAAEANPVVYTDADGNEYRKTDDPRQVALAKRNDALAKQLADSEAARETAEFAKRADDEMGHYPKDTAVRAAIVKAVQGISDEETRKAAFEALKAGDEALAKRFVQIGHEDATLEVGGAESQLNKLAEDYAKANSVGFEVAYAKVLETPEGGKLYTEIVEASPVAQQ
jgi:hypothetical protein